MKYLKTLDLWQPTIQDAICSGQIKLQRGQWLTCGVSNKRCRYVSHTKRTINVIHWQGTSTATTDKFNQAVVRLKRIKILNKKVVISK